MEGPPDRGDLGVSKEKSTWPAVFAGKLMMYEDTVCPCIHGAAVHFNSSTKHFGRVFYAIMDQLNRKSERRQGNEAK